MIYRYSDWKAREEGKKITFHLLCVVVGIIGYVMLAHYLGM
jgi:hypothetical protein